MFVVVPNFRGSFERGGAIGGNIHFGDRILGERHDLEKFSGDDRRVDERGEGNSRELDSVPAVAGHGKRGAELPAVRKLQARAVIDVVRLPAPGIEQNLIPADDRELVGGRGTRRKSTFEDRRRKKVECGGDLTDAGRDFHVDGEAVDQVATPLENLSAGTELQAGEVDHGAVGGVLAGNPLRVIEGEIAGAGGNFQRGVEDLAGGGGGVDGNGHSGQSCAPSGNCQHYDEDCSQRSGEFHSFGASHS